jgi:hypothetical protein
MIQQAKRNLSKKGYTYTLHTTMERVVHDEKGFLVDGEDTVCQHCSGAGKTHRRFISWSSKGYNSLKELNEAESLKFYGFNAPKVKRKVK